MDLMHDNSAVQTLDVVIPVFNESEEVVKRTVEALDVAFAGRDGVHIFVVDDGSEPPIHLTGLRARVPVTMLRHPRNRGYGAALKTGIRRGDGHWIAIADADGTYPVADLPAMVEMMAEDDMVIGVRTGDIREIPWLRRFPKSMLNAFASYMAGQSVPDLNSGLRVFTRSLCHGLWALLPQKFSFTSTLTMGALLSGLQVRNHPINYHKRIGTSSIHPIKDTIRFFFIVLRLGMLFFPMKIFGPISGLLFVLGVVKGFARDFLVQGYLGNLAVALMLAGVQIFMMGMLGEMIVHARHVNLRSRS